MPINNKASFQKGSAATLFGASKNLIMQSTKPVGNRKEGTDNPKPVENSKETISNTKPADFSGDSGVSAKGSDKETLSIPRSLLRYNPGNLLQGVIYSEILGKPKALRKVRW